MPCLVEPRTVSPRQVKSTHGLRFGDDVHETVTQQAGGGDVEPRVAGDFVRLENLDLQRDAPRAVEHLSAESVTTPHGGPGEQHLGIDEQAAGVGKFDRERIGRGDAGADAAEEHDHEPDGRQPEEHEKCRRAVRARLFSDGEAMERAEAQCGPGRLFRNDRSACQWSARNVICFIVSKVKSPPEKKQIAYARDHYNRNGESNKAWRKTKPLKKAKARRAFRKASNDLVRLCGTEPDAASPAAMRKQGSIKQQEVRDWGPVTLREYVEARGTRTLTKSGDRKARKAHQRTKI